MTFQLEMFGAAPLVARYPGDGPFPSEVWRDEGDGRQIRRWFDGVGWCQMLCAPCKSCGIYHPLDLNWGSNSYAARASRCPTGQDDWHQ